MAVALKALEEEDGDFCCAPIGQSQRVMEMSERERARAWNEGARGADRPMNGLTIRQLW
jgi:hypothetical protein